MTTIKSEVFATESFVDEVAARIAGEIATEEPVMITGGDTVGNVYERLASLRPDWAGIDILFSDERAVPPDDERSNFGLAKRTLLDRVDGAVAHRMKGEEDPSEAADAYHEEILPLVEKGIQLAVLGLGDNAHIAGLFPHDPALSEHDRLCVAVDRPDGMKGITLTPPALARPRKILFVIAGANKADAVHRALHGDEAPEEAPVRILAEHPDCTFLLDAPAASMLPPRGSNSRETAG